MIKLRLLQTSCCIFLLACCTSLPAAWNDTPYNGMGVNPMSSGMGMPWSSGFSPWSMGGSPWSSGFSPWSMGGSPWSSGFSPWSMGGNNSPWSGNGWNSSM
ncbi:MAG TPA: hypothetical protein PLM98_07440, partial [Thiolinea sp.]|nr:hypothetical protein [Thiolinea sp.]